LLGVQFRRQVALGDHLVDFVAREASHHPEAGIWKFRSRQEEQTSGLPRGPIPTASRRRWCAPELLARTHQSSSRDIHQQFTADGRSDSTSHQLLPHLPNPLGHQQPTRGEHTSTRKSLRTECPASKVGKTPGVLATIAL
jgi:hypothetical protein